MATTTTKTRHFLLITLISQVGCPFNIDLQVPATFLVHDLLPTLLEVRKRAIHESKAVDTGNVPSWELRFAEDQPLMPTLSLLDNGVQDGMQLFLCQATLPTNQQPLAREPSDPPTPFHLPVREYPSPLPTDEIVVTAPPAVPNKQGGIAVWLQVLLPILGCLGGSLFYFSYAFTGSGGNNPNTRWMLVIAILVPLLSIGAGVATNLMQRWMLRQQQQTACRAYLDYLTLARTQLHDVAEHQRQVSLRLYPPLTDLATYVLQRRYLWERRATDQDFLHVSIGQGSITLCRPPRLDLNPDPLAQGSPALRSQAQALVAKYHHLEHEPIVISLRSFGVITLLGDNAMTRACARALLCQIVAFHAPSDVRCMVMLSQQGLSEWSWLKWLPHVRLLRQVNQAKAGNEPQATPLCLLADTPDACRALLLTQIGPEVARRRKLRQDTQDTARALMLPHLLLLFDEDVLQDLLPHVPELDDLLRHAAELGITILCLLSDRQHEPIGTQARITIVDKTWQIFEHTPFGTHRLEGIIPSPANLHTCEEIARSLAPLTQTDEAAQDEFLHDVRLLDVLGIPSVDALPSWQAYERASILRVPIGRGEKGTLRWLDLKEAAELGDGPHGLVIGATGSGKSELLRTLVTGLALRHDPETLNFLCADFKGGASFADLARLPHMAGMITNLENDPTLIDRMQASLLGELTRRQRMLRQAGNLDNIQQYHAKRQTEKSLDPMPHLLIVVDEFAELLAQRPDFLDIFITIGRLGRSLGLHLLLATQSLDEGRLKGLESYIRYRICLRTSSAAESTTVLSTPDAYYLPSVPGVGYYRVDAQTPERFKTALISVPYVPTPPQIVLADLISTFTATGHLEVTHPTKQQHGASTGQTEMDMVIAHLVQRAKDRTASQKAIPTHQVWLPPLGTNIRLDQLLRGLDGSTWPSSPPFGILRVPIGLLDVPREQIQPSLMLDFCGTGGHLAIVGAPQSGKSTFLRTLVAALLVTHSPRDIQIYALDLGGGNLQAFASAPHVGAVCVRAEREKIQLLFRLVDRIMGEREVYFRTHHIDSMATYRSRRLAGEYADAPFGDVFVIIDNLAQLLYDMEQIETDLQHIVTLGLTYGVHLVVATNRWPDLRVKLRDPIGTRLELRLNDPLESDIDRKKAAELPDGIAGRGLTKEKIPFQVCLPWIRSREEQEGGEHQDISSSPQQVHIALNALINRTHSWRGPSAPPVRLLPTCLERKDLPRSTQGTHAPGEILLGLEEFQMHPVSLDMSTMGPHFLVLGDAECGKTNLLRLWIQELVAHTTPQEVQYAIIECRTTTHLLDETTHPHCLTYASMRQPASVTESVECLVSTLKERMAPLSLAAMRELGHTKAWSGPRYFLFVDDYEVIATPSGSILNPLRDLLLQAREIGFHVVLTRSVSGIIGTSYEPIFKCLRELGSPGLIMSGDRQEGRVLHEQSARNLPEGRGILVQRKYPPTQVQVLLASPSRA